MPTALASLGGFEKSSMHIRSHILNDYASHNDRTLRADTISRCSYKRIMARRGIPKQAPAWFLREWMEACGLNGRGAQARMMELTGWTKATMSQLYNGVQDQNSDYVRTAAQALQIREHELFMHPEAAMALRRFEETAREVANAKPGTPPLRIVENEQKTGTRD
jgi:transcriptional regulator with XRE-family HTH domain